MLAISENCRLSLNLAKNNFGARGGSMIADEIAEITSVTSIDLSGTNIGDEGIIPLCEVIFLMENNFLGTLPQFFNYFN